MSGRTVVVKAFAKLNLGLRILGRRDDGFHELRTVYQAISLCDQVEVSLGGKAGFEPVRLELKGLRVPAGNDNLACRAALGMQKALGLDRHVQIALTKRIPTGGGLGGGSSDAAAVLRALDRLSSYRLDRTKLFQLAAALGSDVPFFLFGGRAVGVGRGEEVYPLPDGAVWHCVIALPADGMNTAEAYRLLKVGPWPPVAAARKSTGRLSRPQPQLTADSFAAALLAENSGSAATLCTPIANDFEPVLFKRFPKLAEARKSLQQTGAQWAALTGSGSAIFGLFAQRAQASAARLKLEGAGMRLFQCRTVRQQQYAAALRTI